MKTLSLVLLILTDAAPFAGILFAYLIWSLIR